MSKSRAKRKFPQLDYPDTKYVQIFYEGQHNDARPRSFAPECRAVLSVRQHCGMGLDIRAGHSDARPRDTF